MISQRRLERIQEVATKRQRDIAIVLEDIHDPHNAAAILRTCDAFGVQQIHYVFNYDVSYNPKRVGKKTSSSANKWVDVQTWRSTEECLDFLKNKGFKTYATILDPLAKQLSETSFDDKLTLILGNEKTGISQTCKKRADGLVYIPMQGFVESLNVSVAAGIMIYEVVRQRGEKAKDFSLKKLQQTKLIEQWREK